MAEIKTLTIISTSTCEIPKNFPTLGEGIPMVALAALKMIANEIEWSEYTVLYGSDIILTTKARSSDICKVAGMAVVEIKIVRSAVDNGRCNNLPRCYELVVSHDLREDNIHFYTLSGTRIIPEINYLYKV